MMNAVLSTKRGACRGAVGALRRAESAAAHRVPATLVALIIAIGFHSACTGRHPTTARPAASSERIAIPFRNLTLKGEYGARFAVATANLLTRQDRYSIASYKASATGTPGALWWDWPGDQIGRMLSVMHVAEGYGWTLAATLRKAVGDAVLPLQTKLGNFGPKPPFDRKDPRLISGNAFALRGLLDAYEDTRDSRYREAAKRLGRYFQRSFAAWKDNGNGILHEFYGHAIDGLVRLYTLGGETWALDLAEKAAALSGRTAHTHHSLSMYRGVIDLSWVRGDKSLLDRVEDYLQWCRENRIASGGLPESMPVSEEDEGCALADYVIVNLMMFRATGKDSYLDDAEHTLVNHFFMNQFHTGGFGHRSYAADIIGGRQWQGWEGRFGSENPGCCSMWGQWALGQAGAFIVTLKGNAIEVNLYPCVSVELPDFEGRLDIESDFPRMKRALLTVHCDKPFRSTFRLRVPAWAEGVEVALNGEAGAGRFEAGRVVLDREWRSGDRVAVDFTGTLRLVPWPDKGSEAAAVYDGPLCLGLSSAVADVRTFDRILVTADGKLALSADGKPQAVNSEGGVVTSLRPIAEDWLAPDVKNPHRLRVLFKKQTAGAASR
jgi:hypothetical protein